MTLSNTTVSVAARANIQQIGSYQGMLQYWVIQQLLIWHLHH
jgi:hypothetical protein